MAALVIKVGALLLKTLAKPLSTRFQNYVMEHPLAREQAVKAAQVVHRIEVWITRGAEGKTGKVFIADMTEEKSLELASKLASETFVFGVGLTIIAFEYERQRRKDLAKKMAEQHERSEILENARRERERLAQENREQQDLIHTLMDRVDTLERRMSELAEEAQRMRQPKGWFGGFLGPRAIQAA
mmetsp:Transcript_23473/g.51528  ORF Transcript_23473/g.51528 Transcript_23473/m.51528 type:complete len:185 (+) Transcript_23473:144-698(+)